MTSNPDVKIHGTDMMKTFAVKGGQRINVLENVSIKVREGTFCSIVGPSGCGKTTLLRIIAGLESLSSGELSVRRDLQSPELVNAMVFQEMSAFPWLTVEGNAAYGLKSLGYPDSVIRERVTYWLEKAHLAPFAKSYPYQLSGGMKQRVSLVRALAMEPSLLLMDEPFGALDEQTRIILQNELLDLWQGTGSTVLFVTHSIDEAVALSDAIFVMSNRPATIKEIVQVPLDRPRDVIALKANSAYGALVSQVWELIRQEVQQAVDLK